MRVALILLFLLALASLPGALLPQWSLNAAKTAQYIVDHPTIGPWLDRLGFFEVFAVAVVRRDLPAAVRLADRLPAAAHAGVRRLSCGSTAGGHPAQPRPAAASRRGRGDRQPRRHGRADHHGPARLADGGAPSPLPRDVPTAQTISAEKGYLREVGNLVFHLSLLGLLVAIAVGKLVGYEGSVIVNARRSSARPRRPSYDNFRPGLLVDGTDLDPVLRRRPAVRRAATPRPARPSTSSRPSATQERRRRRHRRLAERRAAGQRSAAARRRAAVPARPRIHARTSRSPTRPATVREYTQPFAPEPNDPNFTSQGAVKVIDPPGATRRRRPACSSWRSSGSSRRPPSCTAGS